MPLKFTDVPLLALRIPTACHVESCSWKSGEDILWQWGRGFSENSTSYYLGIGLRIGKDSLGGSA